ncbi:hypothetical protein G7Y89_g2617 [Cudoniella acicularis]|uniref:Phosphoglycerate mutase n=1 Tax=Cudoniella acicularis TaxID=354080 RepID=A0A8H4W6C4_9HELO|nr:hypothetical protein G7Y89_g2617 [Cudoniella acicularis]
MPASTSASQLAMDTAMATLPTMQPTNSTQSTSEDETEHKPLTTGFIKATGDATRDEKHDEVACQGGDRGLVFNENATPVEVLYCGLLEADALVATEKIDCDNNDNKEDTCQNEDRELTPIDNASPTNEPLATDSLDSKQILPKIPIVTVIPIDSASPAEETQHGYLHTKILEVKGDMSCDGKDEKAVYQNEDRKPTLVENAPPTAETVVLEPKRIPATLWVPKGKPNLTEVTADSLKIPAGLWVPKEKPNLAEVTADSLKVPVESTRPRRALLAKRPVATASFKPKQLPENIFEAKLLLAQPDVATATGPKIIVHMVRHAESAHKVSAEINYDMPDPNLTEAGEEECQQVAIDFRETSLLSFSQIFSLREDFKIVAMPELQNLGRQASGTGLDAAVLWEMGENEWKGRVDTVSHVCEGWNVKRHTKWCPRQYKWRIRYIKDFIRKLSDDNPGRHIEIVLVTHGSLLLQLIGGEYTESHKSCNIFTYVLDQDGFKRITRGELQDMRNTVADARGFEGPTQEVVKQIRERVSLGCENLWALNCQYKSWEVLFA